MSIQYIDLGHCLMAAYWVDARVDNCAVSRVIYGLITGLPGLRKLDSEADIRFDPVRTCQVDVPVYLSTPKRETLLWQNGVILCIEAPYKPTTCSSVRAWSPLKVRATLDNALLDTTIALGLVPSEVTPVQFHRPDEQTVNYMAALMHGALVN